MILSIDQVLTTEQRQLFQKLLQEAEWEDGKKTAGHLAAKIKNNQQLADHHPLSQQLGEALLGLLSKNPNFLAATLPAKIFPPRFNRYENTGHYGNHIDSAILSVANTPHRVRSDISATLFLSDPDDYEGGELIIEDFEHPKTVKLAAGSLILYPSTSLHRVTPVTKGTRFAAFFWIQSLIRQDSQRRLLYTLDQTIQNLATEQTKQHHLDQLTGVYHNLLRQWSNT
ncbi:Fe2+-dependent dioxygenase [Acinetobacter sp. NIPH 2699]|uniref:Fe2+-dependent dioxygenase n=1 Tax=Acinetobacter sp. NIPH 2699 TaxID=2923433 RepID=UPI001F4BA301|nr:Fe2+-dependent dioxygenase [Acinetobacter sp. NIPH 2699]MCH7335967.1 Fe2+-dependent dioxygenase [Acinetobacter sp. NIPH 2699]